MGVPKLLGYRLRQEILEFEDGAQSQALVKVPVAELEAWDAAHDHSGRRHEPQVQVVQETVRDSKGEETDSSKGQAK